jgi:chromosome segregation protein
MDEERLARADRDAAILADATRRQQDERMSLASKLADAAAREEQARSVLAEIRTADTAERGRLAEVETEALAARERLRAADERSRQADVADLEARLALESIRESVLVELAGLGEPGLQRLAEEAGRSVGSPAVREELPPEDEADGALEAEEAARLEGLLDAVAGDWAARPPAEPPPSPGRLAALRRRYHELGAGNPFAAEEYAELRARLEGLDTQASDLRDAIARTRSLIEELNGLIASQFRATFQALETAFDRRFGQLFGGGFARLSLTDPDDLASTGVEIVARPPGKKAQNLAMLSGGERALTAVALLFAMLEVRPVPFCVLDEVDAALDEANIGRFTDALRGLADTIQFVVITHNRGTIEAADALYGVTAGDDSVSRVVSLRLEEAQAIAEAAHGARNGRHDDVSGDGSGLRDDAVAAS